MKNADTLEFICLGQDCRKPIPVSVLKIEKHQTVTCPNCGKQYSFDPNFIEKIKKFERLILAVRDAEDILGDTNVGINVDGHQIKLPYRLLLTRMNTLMTLNVGGKEFAFKFRVEPLTPEQIK